MISTLAAGEFTSAISRLLRMGEIDRDFADDRLSIFDEWCAGAAEIIETEAADISLGAAFARRFNLALRMPDAIHAATCQRHGLCLVTFDVRLDRAARALGIATLVPA